MFSRLLSRLGSWGLVGLIAVALIVWMLSGDGTGPDFHAAPTPSTHSKRVTVTVREHAAETVAREITFNGESRPDLTVKIGALAEGVVVAVGPRKGARVAEGDLLARVHPRELEQQKIRAEAALKARELDYQAAEKMRGTGYITENDLAARNAARESARTDLAEIELNLRNLTVRAPASGVLEERAVEAGDYVKLGQTVAKIIRIDPLVVAGGVNESEIAHLSVGGAARAEVQGQTLDGRVRFVSAMADERTRSFSVEIAVANPGSRIPAGLSARVTVPGAPVRAHKLPASLLSLADDGAVGVKHMVNGKVVFTIADIVRADGDAVWVSGLPDTMQLITRGQGFVTAGSEVNAQLEDAAATAPATPKTGG